MNRRITLADDEVDLIIWLLDDAIRGGDRQVSEVAKVTQRRLLSKLRPEADV